MQQIFFWIGSQRQGPERRCVRDRAGGLSKGELSSGLRLAMVSERERTGPVDAPGDIAMRARR